jgi:hypothetical protein
VREERRSSS